MHTIGNQSQKTSPWGLRPNSMDIFTHAYFFCWRTDLLMWQFITKLSTYWTCPCAQGLTKDLCLHVYHEVTNNFSMNSIYSFIIFIPLIPQKAQTRQTWQVVVTPWTRARPVQWEGCVFPSPSPQHGTSSCKGLFMQSFEAGRNVLCAAGHLFVTSLWSPTLPSQGDDVGAATTGGQWGWEGLCIAERSQLF